MEKETTLITVEDYDYLAILFGLNETFATRIAKLSDFHLQHESVSYFLFTWLYIIRGIDKVVGSPRKDLSHRVGFYLTDSHDAAVQWGRNKDDDEHCVIIFKIPNELLDAQRHGGLNVSNNLGSFLKVVNYKSQ
ncbi:hypothetical protein BgiMline_036562 [Biomphalaria glabrata]